MGVGDISIERLEKLVAEVKPSGGSEMSNYQLFVERLTGALGLPQPEFAREETRFNDYVFERNVTFRHPNGTSSTGRIDCYKRGCFVLEAKQSAKRQQAIESEQLALAGIETAQKLGHAKRGTKSWDKVMIAARRQAEDYARALPVDHGYPPFLLIVDVGNVIEVYADFSGLGKNYDHFPDRQNYRLSMDDLLLPEVQERLAAIWTAPQTLNPTLRAAEVTRDIAERLAKIAKRLEKKYAPVDIAQFLMRCLFTMFAEDVGPEDEAQRLIPNRGFERLLHQMIDTPEHFAPALESLWRVMDSGGYAPHLNASIKRFNGALFKDSRALKLDQDDILELHNAARRRWGDVEPAIFGTLLESALDPTERSQLGAHYTPRPYVERLVIPTIMEPLRADWEEVKAAVEDLRQRGAHDAALQAVRDFHHRLCTLRVLDPACGTGNFLYVSLELMKRLEGEVLDALDALGESESKLLLDGETVSPRQFFGLELNPRAVPIADLVLWIGFLKWQLKTVDVKDIPEPILNAYGTIRHQDALIAYDARELARDGQGNLITIWDGVTRKLHPITGEEVPDETARKETYHYVKPRRAAWPEAEFIVGNPPFIGGKDMRAELGDGYAEACWKVRPDVPGGADFVMHFWDEAARRLTAKPAKKGAVNPLRRFGFITTNSITQTFSRRVVEWWMNAKDPLSLIYAVPDHPWMKSADKAAVRIAMTVAQVGNHEGVLAEVVGEAALNTDAPKVELDKSEGKITSHLRIGADLSKSLPLLANELVASPGVKLHGAGFIVTPKEAAGLGLGSVPGLEAYILHYRHGRDLAQRPRGVMVIDLFGLTAEQVRDRFPAVYQRVVDRVKPERDQNNRAVRRNNWWLFGETAPLFREYTAGIGRYLATGETAKHRFFQFLDAATRADNMLLAIGSDAADHLAILSSRLHVHWALTTGGTLEDRPRYNKTKCFDPFPFPLNPSRRLTELGERLDAFRKERLAAHDFLTMTGLYNALERVRELDAGIGDPLTDAERDTYDAGQIAILKELHDEIDREVFAAYGWSDLGLALVGKPGGTTPSTHKSAEQEAAEEELLVRLVALNQERAGEEKAGVVHWLRPDFQKPRLAAKVKGAVQVEADLGEVVRVEAVKWPSDGLDQIRSVRDLLARAESPIAAPVLAAAFGGRTTPKRRERVEQVLETLVATGAARRDEATRGYYLPK
ncbi:class I SAM-dependent DNA methyltransferase [Sphingopyxis kveilinensis]|uniref:class I SAM-dependent DNA methyltransferase n=1 Tax=Sphingopyxis kveilinensis TaxID=3114367 RepID=UPI0030D0D722